jgi:hypothetical protein
VSCRLMLLVLLLSCQLVMTPLQLVLGAAEGPGVRVVGQRCNRVAFRSGGRRCVGL